MTSGRAASDGAEPAFLRGGGETSALVRALDWSKTPLGPIESWSGSLRAVVGIILGSRHPMFLWWGPELIQIYNDAYLPSFGNGKHPAAMGQPGRECWQEIWPIIGPQIDDVMTRGKASWNEDQLVPILRNGRLEEVYWTYGYSPVYDDDGSVGGTLVVCTETTSRVLGERRLETLRRMAERTAFAATPSMALATDLTDQVTARRALERAQVERDKLLAELEAASRAKDEFLAMLGHELRNPLSPIVTALELMKLRGSDQESSRERQVTHLVRLVDDLLDISKITRGQIELRKETVEVAAVLAKAVELASFLLEKRSHHLTIEVKPGLRWHGDPARLAQVVANLLTNAARYTQAGGRIQLWAAEEGAGLAIGVKDNGIGIPPEVLPRVFDLFFQGKRNVDRAEGGLGIGLTLVKNLVALHGGRMEASSGGPGQGSEFVIRLPATSPPLPAAPAQIDALPAPQPAAGKKRVLVVDDNEDAAELLGEMLRTVGHEVAVVNDPIAALTLLDEFRPEVAVLDIGLPVMDGYELAMKMRVTKAGAGCRLIALTGYGQDHDRARSAQAGFAVHLVKPVDLDRLLAIVAA